jgi:RHS repeat-associated protein
VTYSYDVPMDRLTSMVWRQGSTQFASWAYTHNDRGQRLTSTDFTQRSAAYGYDDASRLVSETITGDPGGASFNGTLSYVLDAVGNRSSRTSTLAALAAQSFTYNANDEISGDTFDANGNTTVSDGHTYAYDFENRVVSKDSGAVTATYDCDGNRVAKTVGSVATRYLFDDLNPTGYLQVLEEVVGGAVQTRYTYGASIVSQTRNISSIPATSYYGFDAHGNITFLTDASGAVTDSYDYDAWGNLVASTGTAPNTRLYAGEELDPDLGLVNLRARLYGPHTGQFLTIDPAVGVLTQPLTLKRYLYAGGDPVDNLDPRGRDILGYYSVSSIGRRIADAAAGLLLLGIRAGAAAAYEHNPVQNYSAKMIAAVAGFWGDVSLADSIISPYPILGAIGIGHTLYCMLRLTFWETDNQGRLLEVPTITGPDDPTPALCGWSSNPIPG